MENAEALSKLADANRKMTLAELLAKAMIELESDDETDYGIKFVRGADAVDQYFGL